jgi:hypothetical protein
MKAYGGVYVYIHISFTSALNGDEWPASRTGRFTLVERAPGTQLIGGWVDPRAGLDDLEKRKFLTLPSVVQPVASRYTTSPWLLEKKKIIIHFNRTNQMIIWETVTEVGEINMKMDFTCIVMMKSSGCNR